VRCSGFRSSGEQWDVQFSGFRSSGGTVTVDIPCIDLYGAFAYLACAGFSEGVTQCEHHGCLDTQSNPSLLTDTQSIGLHWTRTSATNLRWKGRVTPRWGFILMHTLFSTAALLETVYNAY